jgi:hypothetical protein
MTPRSPGGREKRMVPFQQKRRRGRRATPSPARCLAASGCARSSGSPLAVLAPNHLANSLDLAVALDAGLEQRRRCRRHFPRGSSRFSGPVGCHVAAS